MPRFGGVCFMLLSESDQKNIVEAITEAERQTSGEIKVHVEKKCPSENPVARAGEIFELLSLHKTALRNGVLIYLAYEDHKFAILGDKGINEKVGQGFWDSTRNMLSFHFRKGEFTEGLCNGIFEAGQQLKKYFPFQPGDVNELPDEISFG